MKTLVKVIGVIIAVICYGLYKDFDAVDYVAWVVVISAVALPVFILVEQFGGES